jgi:mono/diheme cytochrome c family protein
VLHSRPVVAEVRSMSERAGRRTWATGAALLFLAQAASASAQESAAQQNKGTWDAPPESKQLQNPVKGDGQTVERGKKLYLQHCVPCHGPTGVGDGVMAKKLGYKPANLTLEPLNRQTDGEIFWKISKGRPPMPDWEKQLSERQRWDVVSYVRTLLKLGQ